MKYFLDSAKIDEIRYAYINWGIEGVTINPKHIKNTDKSFMAVIKELAEEFKGKNFPISIEINPHLTKANEMISEARKYSILSKNFVIKVPCNEQGLIAAKKLTMDDIRVNVTLVFSVTQAIQAGRIGATYCSPFIGWQEARDVDTTKLLFDIGKIFDNYNFNTEIIAAAIRNGRQITDAALAGIDIITAGFNVYKTSFNHPITEKGLKIFREAWDETPMGKL
ncbi:MAG: transaldolase family protein [Promethearchaeota archaeon]